jgi:uncharacterized delta-60 repeat protein
MRFARLLLTAALCPSLAAVAAPGELDATFAGTGWVALGGGTNPQAESVCVDPSQRIVVGAARQATLGAPWQAYLVRYTASGVLDTAFGPGGWRAIGATSGSAAQQMPTVLCLDERYVATSIDDAVPAWFGVRLDQVPVAGGAASSVLLAAGNVAHSPRVALAALGGGRWLVGPSRTDGGSGSIATLQRWDGTSAPLAWMANWSGPAGNPQSDYTDVFVDPIGRAFAVGRRKAAGLQGMGAFVSAFSANGAPLAGFGSGGSVHFDTPLEDYGQRIAPSAFGGQFYTGIAEIDVATGAATARIRRLQPTGTLDAMFGGANGVAIAGALIGDIAEDNNGRLLVVGKIDDAAFVRRLQANGVPDATFGPNGERRFGFGSNHAMFTGIAFDALGRIVLSGWRQEVQRGGTLVTDAAIVARLQP